MMPGLHQRYLVSVACLFVFSCNPYAQSEVRLEIGRSFIDEDFPGEQVYDLWQFSLCASRHLVDFGDRVYLNGVLETYYGDATTISQGKHDFDAAANLALELLWQFHRAVGLRFAIGSGPGYQSSVSTVQARGFIFSNNCTLGFRLAFANDSIIVSPQVRFRHMSNAGLKSPNSGIDNFLFLIGVAVPLEENK